MPSVDIYSVNYDFMPTIPYAAKSFWVQMVAPVQGLHQGKQVYIESLDPNFVPPPGPLVVIDAIGTRVMLTVPRYLRTGQWGYSTRNLASYNRPMKSWVYGYGNPIAKLIY